MKTISLTQGKVAIVDDEDFDRVNQFKWCAVKSRRTYYAQTGWLYDQRIYHQDMVKRGQNPPREKRSAYLHRLICNPPQGLEVDHIDGDGLNNQRSNLRIVTHRQNHQNRHCGHNGNGKKTSRFPGVSWCERTKKWRSQIRINNIVGYLPLGSFPTEESAFAAYQSACAGIGETVI